jgi:hypothetical protein
MGKRFESKRVKCPYYKSQNRSVIFCQGYMPGTSIHMAFASPGERVEYQKEVCFSLDYESNCLIAKAHELRWTN